MRKFVISLAAAGAALAVATPAAAQYYPQPQHGYGDAALWSWRLRQRLWLQRRLQRLRPGPRAPGADRRAPAPDPLLDRRDASATAAPTACATKRATIERGLRQAARNGLNPYEANDIRCGSPGSSSGCNLDASRDGRYGYGNGYNGYRSASIRRPRRRDDRDGDDRGHDRDDDTFDCKARRSEQFGAPFRRTLAERQLTVAFSAATVAAWQNACIVAQQGERICVSS